MTFTCTGHKRAGEQDKRGLYDPPVGEEADTAWPKERF
jgi:hypothetical protein